MAKSKKTTVKVERPEGKKTKSTTSAKTTATSDTKGQSLFEKMQLDLQKNQSYLNYILGGLIVLIVGVLLFNYFNKPNQNVGPSQQTEQNQEEQKADVSKENLPGQYTIKEGDTLFVIAQKYYNDGYKYPEIVKENKLQDENTIEVGQVITIPKLEESAEKEEDKKEQSQASPSPESTPQAEKEDKEQPAQGGAENATIWGERISGDTYTVKAGDWLSTIAGRAYGDPMQYEKIAKANNIQNPDVIEVGTTLKLPR